MAPVSRTFNQRSLLLVFLPISGEAPPAAELKLLLGILACKVGEKVILAFPKKKKN